MRPALITYEGLPLSSGGAHRLRTKGFVNAWRIIEHFLKERTDFARPEEIVIELLEGASLPDEFVTPLKQRFTLEFPVVRSRAVGEAVGRQWSVGRERLPALLQELEAVQPLPDFFVQPLAVDVALKFRLVDRSTRKPLPFQNPSDYLHQDAGCAGHQLSLGSSVASARISTRSTLFVFLSLPFAEVSAELRDYVEFLGSAAPFTFSEKHWKVWTLNREGSGYVGRRIPGGGMASPRGGS
jgi:hypothetical protein